MVEIRGRWLLKLAGVVVAVRFTIGGNLTSGSPLTTSGAFVLRCKRGEVSEVRLVSPEAIPGRDYYCMIDG